MSDILFAQSSGTVAQNTDEEEIRRRIRTSRDALKTSADRERRLAAEAIELDQQRASINRQLLDVARRIQDGEGKLTEIEGRITQLAEQKQVLVTSLRREHRNLGRLLAALQRMGRNPPPVIATPEGDALAMVRSAMLLARVFPELRGKAEVLTSQLEQLNSVVAEIETRGEQLRAENDELRGAQERLAGLLDTKRRSLIDTQTELAEVRRIAEQHRKSVASLNELIARLDRTVAEKAGLGEYERELAAGTAPGQVAATGDPATTTAELRPSQTPDDTPNATENGTVAGAPATQQQPWGNRQVVEATAPPLDPDVEIAPDKRTRVALLNPGRIKPALPFAQAHEALPLPAQGRRIWGFDDTTRYGSKSKGVALETRFDAQVTSPSDGWVVYAGPFLRYGQLLIVNAGGGYHVLLAGMSKIDVVVGQFVLSGEPVGKMAVETSEPAPSENGDDVSPVLYVEFRKDGRPIDPDPWWAKGPKKVQG